MARHASRGSGGSVYESNLAIGGSLCEEPCENDPSSSLRYGTYTPEVCSLRKRDGLPRYKERPSYR